MVVNPLNNCKHHYSQLMLHNLLFYMYQISPKGIPRGHNGKESTCQCRRYKRHVFNHCVKKISWRRKWQQTPLFLPGKLHWQKNLVGYSLWGYKEWGMTERLSPHTHTSTHTHTLFACKLNKQGDSIEPWHTSFPILNKSAVPCPVLTVAS